MGDLAALRRTTASERGASLSIEPWWLKMKRNMRLILPMHANLLLLFFSKLNLVYLDTVRACMCVYVCVCMILCTGVHMRVCSINSYLNKSEVFLFWVLSYILQIYNIQKHNICLYVTTHKQAKKQTKNNKNKSAACAKYQTVITNMRYTPNKLSCSHLEALFPLELDSTSHQLTSSTREHTEKKINLSLRCYWVGRSTALVVQSTA